MYLPPARAVSRPQGAERARGDDTRAESTLSARRIEDAPRAARTRFPLKPVQCKNRAYAALLLETRHFRAKRGYARSAGYLLATVPKRSPLSPGPASERADTASEPAAGSEFADSQLLFGA